MSREIETTPYPREFPKNRRNLRFALACATVAVAGLVAAASGWKPPQAVAQAGESRSNPTTTTTVAGESALVRADRAALVALYNATNGRSWHVSTNWNTLRPLNEWHGVETDSSGRVESLNLHNNGLSGPLPTEIGNLTNLEYLDLSHSGFSGPLPTEIGNLTNLEYLDLTSSGFSGPLPTEIGNLTNLEYLDLTSSGFSGPLPTEIGNLTNLEYLDLTSSGFSGPLPTEIGNLTNLEYLDLTSSGFSGPLPTEIGNLTNLTSLDLTSSGFSGPLPTEIGNLTNLTSLDLTSSRFSGPLPTEIGNLTNLEYLDLTSSRFSGPLPTEIGNLTNLTSLDLTSSRFSGPLPTEIGNLTNLTSLGLSYGGFSGPLPTEIGNLTNLQRLGLSHSGFSGPLPTEIGNLTNLEYLNLTHNLTQKLSPGGFSGPLLSRSGFSGPLLSPGGFSGPLLSPGGFSGPLLSPGGFSGPLPTEIGNLTNLQRLYLTSSGFSGPLPTEIGNLTNLQRLGLSHSGFSGPLPTEIGNLTNLTSLDLYASGFSGPLPTEIGNLTSLDYLYLSHSGFSGPLPTEIGNLTNLTSLDLTHSGFSGPLPTEIGDLTNLTGLDLADNDFSGPLPTEIGNLTNLTGLDLADNGFSGPLPTEIGNLTNLTGLDLADNDFSGPLPTEIGNLTNLDYLDLADNDFSGTLPTEIGNLTNLDYLYLTNNDFSGTLPTEIGNLTSLDYLYLTNNDFSGTLPTEIGNLTSLDYLGLADNGFSGTLPTEIGNLTSLDYLGLADNGFSGTLPTEIGNLTSLDYLYLADNGFSGTLPTEIGNLTKLEYLDLADNDFSGTLPTEIGNLTNLASLDLADNDFSGTLPTEIGNLTSLDYLYLTNNDFSGTLPTEIGNLTSLDYLDLADNDFSGTLPTEIGNLTSLDYLDLTNNDFSGTLPTEIGNLTNLASLDLADNDFSGTLPTEIGNLTNLASLDLADNDFSGTLPTEIGNLTNLASLDLADNDFSGTLPTEIGNLTNLRILNLADNDFSGTLPTEIGNLTNLDYLYLTGNDISGCMPSALVRVYIDVSRSLLPFCAERLQALSVAEGVLVPVFGGETLAYTVVVPFAASEVTVSAESEETGSLVSFERHDGSEIVDGDAQLSGHQVSFPAATSELVVNVKVAAGTVGEATYALRVLRRPRVTVSYAEPTGEGGNFVFTVALSHESSVPVVVGYEIADGTAVAGEDYSDPSSSYSLEIVAGSLEATFTVATIEDTPDVYEGPETFVVNFSAVGAELAQESVEVSIADEQPQVLVPVQTSVDEDAGTAEIVVSLDKASVFAVPLSYQTADGSAIEADFTAAQGSVTIGAGDRSASLSIPVVDDSLDEDIESFTVEFSIDAAAAGHAVFGSDGSAATVSITDDDSAPVVSASDVSVVEGAGSAEVVFALDAVSGRDVVVEYGMVDGEAVGGSDYVSAAGSVTIEAGRWSGAVLVVVSDDGLDEVDESFVVEITGVTNAVLDPDDVAGHSATVTIADDDDPPVVSVADVSVGEGAGSAVAVFALSSPSGRDVTVTYGTVEGSALGDSADEVLDFVPVVAGVAVIAAGEVSVSVPIVVNDDSVHEVDESFVVEIADVVNAVLDPDDTGGHSATVTIEDDDAVSAVWGQPVVTVSEGTPEVVVSVSLSPVPVRSVELVFSTGAARPDGVPQGSREAAAGEDYVAVRAAVVAVAAGESTAQLRVGLRDDLLDETDMEWLAVSVSADADSVLVPSSSVVVLIADDDSVPFVSAADVSVGEGAGSAAVVFSLSAPSGRDVAVTYSTSEGTALADISEQELDFVSVASGEAVIAAGEVSVSVPIVVHDDSDHERDEAFTVGVDAVTNAALDPNDTTSHSASVTIVDDDAVTVSWSAPVLFVGEGAAEAVLSVSVSPVPERSIELVYTTDLAAATRSRRGPRAVSSSSPATGDDYTRVAPTTVTVAAGEGSVELPVAIIDDMLDETDTEWFLVWLSADPADAVAPLAPATIFIADNDAPPAVSVADVTVSEDTVSAEVVFTLDAVSGRDITVSYATAAGTAEPSTIDNDGDYVSAAASVRIVAGNTTASAAIEINDDTLHETDETFTVDITAATNATVDRDNATVTITDDDGPRLSVADLKIDESTTEQANTARFEVTLNPTSTDTVTVQYATSDGTAQAGLDYTQTSGTLTFAPGDATAYIDVAILHDDLDEHDETLTLTLDAPTNAALDRATATATISDDDDMPTVSITPATATTTEGEDTNLTITLDTASGRDITVTITATGSGTHHTHSSDYSLNQQEVTLQAGATTATFTITAAQDTLDEHDETFTATITADHATPHTHNNNATITITDDDNPPDLTATAEPATEGTTATVTLQLSAASGKNITIQYSIINITTTNDDYTHTSTEITIEPGTTTTTINIDINDDTTHEGTEFFMLQLSQATNTNTATGTLVIITANDSPL